MSGEEVDSSGKKMEITYTNKREGMAYVTDFSHENPSLINVCEKGTAAWIKKWWIILIAMGSLASAFLLTGVKYNLCQLWFKFRSISIYQAFKAVAGLPWREIPFSNILITLPNWSSEFQVIKIRADAFQDCVCVHKEACHMLMSIKWVNICKTVTVVLRI